MYLRERSVKDHSDTQIHRYTTEEPVVELLGELQPKLGEEVARLGKTQYSRSAPSRLGGSRGVLDLGWED